MLISTIMLLPTEEIALSGKRLRLTLPSRAFCPLLSPSQSPWPLSWPSNWRRANAYLNASIENRFMTSDIFQITQVYVFLTALASQSCRACIIEVVYLHLWTSALDPLWRHKSGGKSPSYTETHTGVQLCPLLTGSSLWPQWWGICRGKWQRVQC